MRWACSPEALRRASCRAGATVDRLRQAFRFSEEQPASEIRPLLPTVRPEALVCLRVLRQERLRPVLPQAFQTALRWQASLVIVRSQEWRREVPGESDRSAFAEQPESISFRLRQVRQRESVQVFRFQRRKRGPAEDQGSGPEELQAGDRWHRNCAGRQNSAPGRALQYPGREDARQRRNTGNE